MMTKMTTNTRAGRGQGETTSASFVVGNRGGVKAGAGGRVIVNAAGSTPTSPPSIPFPPAATGFSPDGRVVGAVTGVDPAAATVTVRTRSGAAVVVRTDAATGIAFPDEGAAATLDDLLVGDILVVTAEPDGVARRIAVERV
jgi:hypothetical protein